MFFFKIILLLFKDRYPMFLNQRLNIVKMSTLHKRIYRFHASAVKIPMAFFTEIVKTILKSVWNSKRPQEAKRILRKKKT